MTQNNEEIIALTAKRDKNIGHGHVYTRPDGNRMRCGGPLMCPECSSDAQGLAKELVPLSEVQPLVDALRDEVSFYRDMEPICQKGQSSRCLCNKCREERSTTWKEKHPQSMQQNRPEVK